MNAKDVRQLKTLSIFTILIISLLSIWSAHRALQIPMSYSADQFLPKGHELIESDRNNHRIFNLPIYSPLILVITQQSPADSFLKTSNLEKLQRLSREFEDLGTIGKVTGLGNIETAIERDDQLLFGTVADLRKQGLTKEKILKNPMFVPALLSRDGLSTAIMLLPSKNSVKTQSALSAEVVRMAQKSFPHSRIQMGGPASIVTELLKLLSKEIVIFLALSLLGSLVVLKLLFRGWSMIFWILLILAASNLVALGIISLMPFSFNMLSSTLTILITVCCLGIITRTLVRMGQLDNVQNQKTALIRLLKDMWQPHMLAAITTSVGFATLIPSDVPLISQYGMGVTVGVMVGALVTLALIPAIYLWMPWPRPRGWLSTSKGFAIWMLKHNWQINAFMFALVIVFLFIGSRLSWTSKLYDDLPSNHKTRRTTDFIGAQLGGSVTYDVRVELDEDHPWKTPKNLLKLQHLAGRWRRNPRIGSVLTLSDFMSAGRDRLPSSTKAFSEIQFLFGMAQENPLIHFISNDEKSTRLSFRFPDLPSDKIEFETQNIVKDIRQAFPNAVIQAGSLAAVVPKVNNEVSKKLMWGFFDAMFWIVLMLALVFRSIRWALVAAIPNFLPPIMLLGFLALFQVPIKPGIAIIFSISLGLAFDNTVYILDRLKITMKKYKSKARLPIARVIASETNPCLVSSLSLLVGFSIFLFSYFRVNQLFGAFMMISIGAGLLADLVWLPALIRRFPFLLHPIANSDTLKRRPQWMVSTMKLTPYALLVFLGLISVIAAHAESVTPDKVLKEVEARSSPPQETAQLKMVIQEPDGNKKERLISILRKNGKEQKALVRLETPTELKGVALLSVQSAKKQDQWLYLPSAKKTRRIQGSNQKGKFLDSEIAYEDLRISNYKDFQSKVVNQTPSIVEIESVARPGSLSSYSRLKSWVSLPDYKLMKAEYWDKKGRLLKRTEFKDYQKVGDKFWRAKTTEVQNVQNNRKTVLELKKVSLKKISDDDLSLSALED